MGQADEKTEVRPSAPPPPPQADGPAPGAPPLRSATADGSGSQPSSGSGTPEPPSKPATDSPRPQAQPRGSGPKPPAPATPEPGPARKPPAQGTGGGTGAASSKPGEAKPPGGSKPGGSKPGAKPAGLSTLSAAGLERTIIRRGLATEEEVNACKAQRQKQAAQGSADAKGLLEFMVASKVLTPGQAQRLVKELSTEAQRKHEIPGYQILERLGKGSMGIVYKARQTSVDRIVAVKVLLDVLAKNKEFIRRFDREAKIAARLNHPHVVNAIDAGEVNGLNYFVMEYVEGTTIKDELEKGKVYEEREALEIVLAIAQALQHAHERGLIHRDVKPENIILTKEGNIKLADLGLARLTADEKWAAAEAGMAIGTPYYISPEQVRGATDIDIRSDIYNLGATLYHMVTGRVPYMGSDPNEVMKMHVDKNVQLVPPDHINTQLSSGLGQVVETMMARNREGRYRDPADLILDLKALLRGEPPIIAAQAVETLADLASAESDDESAEEEAVSLVTDEERQEMAAKVNTRDTIVVVLAIFLGMALASNILLLLTR